MPDWVRWAWAGLFGLTLGQHLAHVLRMCGLHRLWHSGHMLMAIGMGFMFLPRYNGIPGWVWEVLFAAATALAGGYGLVMLHRGTRIDLAWITLVAGFAAMVYMWAMMDGFALAPISYAAALWFSGEAVGWFTGELCGRRDKGWLPPAVARPRAGVKTGAYLTGSMPIAYAATWPIRTTLGLMAAGMAYMLIGMQLML